MEGGDAYRIVHDMENVDMDIFSFFVQVSESSKDNWS